MWSAVIAQAKADVQNKKVARATRKQAANWLRGERSFPGDPTDYFAEVCELAGVDHNFIREQTVRRLALPAPSAWLPKQLGLLGPHIQKSPRPPQMSQQEKYVRAARRRLLGRRMRVPYLAFPRST